MFDAVVDFVPRPHEAVLEILQDVYLPDPFRSALFPSTPVFVVVEIILRRVDLEDLIPGLGPGKFVSDFSHLFISPDASSYPQHLRPSPFQFYFFSVPEAPDNPSIFPRSRKGIAPPETWGSAPFHFSILL
jgi:hypothetical protein